MCQGRLNTDLYTFLIGALILVPGYMYMHAHTIIKISSHIKITLSNVFVLIETPIGLHKSGRTEKRMKSHLKAIRNFRCHWLSVNCASFH